MEVSCFKCGIMHKTTSVLAAYLPLNKLVLKKTYFSYFYLFSSSYRMWNQAEGSFAGMTTHQLHVSRYVGT